MDVTVVVTPRERFSQLPDSLESLFATIPNSVRVIVNDGGAPEAIREKIREIKAHRPFEHVEPPHFIMPAEARNAALAQVTTEYVVYADNDVRYDDGWLEALVGKADETGAGAVCPVSVIGPLPNRPIHHAGSAIDVYVDEDGYHRLRSEHRLEWVPLKEAQENNWNGISLENEEFEYHCTLIRTRVMRAVGGHDERQSHYDHLNDSLQIKALGHSIYLAPDAVIEYQGLRKFKDYDWAYFMWRWSLQNSTDSAKQITEAWGVWKHQPGGELDFVHIHRTRAVRTVVAKWKKRIRPRRLSKFLVKLEVARHIKMASKTPYKRDPLTSPIHGLEGLLAGNIKGVETVMDNGAAKAAAQ